MRNWIRLWLVGIARKRMAYWNEQKQLYRNIIAIDEIVRQKHEFPWISDELWEAVNAASRHETRWRHIIEDWGGVITSARD